MNVSNALDIIASKFPGRIMSGDIDLSGYMSDAYTPKVKAVDYYRDDLIKRLRQKEQIGDKSGFAIDMNFRFRPCEITIWSGYKGHGKSILLSQVLLRMLKDGKKIFICSPEFHPVELLYRNLVQLVGSIDPSEEEAHVALDWLTDKLWLYDVQASLKPRDVPALCRWVAENIKPDHIVIDSLMKCGIAPDDYSSQKILVDKLQTVAHQNPLHIHLVAHAKKGQNDDNPPRLHDIKGASEIGDLAENVLTVWRNKNKEKERSYGEASKHAMEPDAVLTVEAQRNAGGWIGQIILNYNRDSMTFYENGRDWRDYVSIRNEVVL